MKIVLNDQTGLKKGTTFLVGERELEVTVLSVEESRSAWVKLLPWIKGMMMSEELEEAGEGGLGPVAMASVANALSEPTFNSLTEMFAKRTQYLQVERAVSGTDVTQRRSLAERGVLDAVFAGNFEALIDWLDVCIELNFGKTIAKLYGALVANGSLKKDTGVSDPAPKAQPTELV